LAAHWGGDARWQVDNQAQPHEAQMLKLDCSKALQSLDWRPALPLKEALRLTADWYRRWNAGEDPRGITLGQIKQYVQLSKDNCERAHSPCPASL
jgi:CDP-glucose 4,6-dehydratase